MSGSTDDKMQFPNNLYSSKTEHVVAASVEIPRNSKESHEFFEGKKYQPLLIIRIRHCKLDPKRMEYCNHALST